MASNLVNLLAAAFANDEALPAGVTKENGRYMVAHGAFVHAFTFKDDAIFALNNWTEREWQAAIPARFVDGRALLSY